jgi:hypothetical protein
MADPISVTASIFSLIEFSTECAAGLGRLIHDYRHAPDEIIALSNEVYDFNLILDELQNFCHTFEAAVGFTHSSTAIDKALTSQLLLARSKVTKIDALRQALTTVLPSGEIGFQRHLWLYKKQEVKRLQHNLKEIRQKLAMWLETATAYVILF